MDPFWGITLSVIAISSFWKRETNKSKERKIRNRKFEDKLEQEKQKEVIEKYTAIFSEPLTPAEEKAKKLREDIEKQKERDTERLRKEGYTDELIAVILPTINNGQ